MAVESIRPADDDDAAPPGGVVKFREVELEFRTIPEARRLATLIAHAFPEPERVEIGLAELLINAVEHGNLGITYDEKSALLDRGELGHEIDRRASRPELAARRVRVTVSRLTDRIVAAIEDEGSGFDWRAYLERDPPPSLDPNGRGIMIAREVSFDRLAYNERGNVVTAEVELDPVSRTRAKRA